MSKDERQAGLGFSDKNFIFYGRKGLLFSKISASYFPK
jgi:hypothetical protein